MPATEVVRLEEAQLEAAAHALSRAFQSDPLQTYVFPDAAERAARSPAHFAAILRYGLRFGEVLTTPGTPLGAAIWLPPGGWEVTPERAAEGGLDQLSALLGEAPAERFLGALAAIEPFHHSDVPPDHWYTMVVGVAPEAQGRGLGHALLEPVIRRADGARQACYLETAQPSNVAFYTELGFRVLRDTVDSASGLRMWTFRRDPILGASAD